MKILNYPSQSREIQNVVEKENSFNHALSKRKMTAHYIRRNSTKNNTLPLLFSFSFLSYHPKYTNCETYMMYFTALDLLEAYFKDSLGIMQK